ncbi:MAG: hypothetical protein CME70_03285 [Halobacteriovorax sp.]|nr:hypothetical protein [Halobacteriovorax sp.]MBK23007.1 hypothetical protein [Halobacteriovorax sp.]|tara:strand:- start:63589 stop:63981 length:393 start_codon:yes stop_codon:yes gene_type:complete
MKEMILKIINPGPNFAFLKHSNSVAPLSKKEIFRNLKEVKYLFIQKPKHKQKRNLEESIAQFGMLIGENWEKLYGVFSDDSIEVTYWAINLAYEFEEDIMKNKYINGEEDDYLILIDDFFSRKLLEVTEE